MVWAPAEPASQTQNCLMGGSYFKHFQILGYSNMAVPDMTVPDIAAKV